MNNLYLEYGTPESLPSDFEKLSELPVLRVLEIKGNINRLPASVGGIKNLEYLELLDSSIEELPAEFAQLKNLEILYINNDPEFDLKKNVGVLSQLPELNELHLEGDHFTQLPAEIKELQALEYLYLNDNQLRELPAEVRELKKLQYIDVSGNDIPSIMLEQYRNDMSPTVKLMFQ